MINDSLYYFVLFSGFFSTVRYYRWMKDIKNKPARDYRKIVLIFGGLVLVMGAAWLYTYGPSMVDNYILDHYSRDNSSQRGIGELFIIEGYVIREGDSWLILAGPDGQVKIWKDDLFNCDKIKGYRILAVYYSSDPRFNPMLNIRGDLQARRALNGC